MARKARKPRDAELYDVDAGDRMRQLFDKARVDFGLATEAELWRKLGVGRDTAQAWMRGERPPSRDLGERIAKRLRLSYSDVLDVYNGRKSGPDTAQVVATLEWVLAKIRSGEWPIAETPDDRAPQLDVQDRLLR